MDSSKFLFIQEYQQRDLKYILNSIYVCYQEIISNIRTISHLENEIRDVFISDEYLNNHTFKQKLKVSEFLFDKEIETLKGRADIRVLNMIEEMSGKHKPYYFIECKVLDNTKPSNAKSNLYSKYINNGINRFINEIYPTYNNENGMIGFYIEPTDIKKQCEFFTDLTPYEFIDNFEFSYVSTHTTVSKKHITLYHLMLDFSSKIKKPNP